MLLDVESKIFSLQINCKGAGLVSESISVNELGRNKISFLLVTAAEPEMKAVLKAMRPLERKREIIKAVGKNQSYNIGTLGKYSVAHVFCKDQGSIKEGASILTINEALREIRPKACVMIGIAYGADKEKQAIGDVLISEAVQPYDSIRVSTDGNGKLYIEDRNKPQIPGNIIRNQFINFNFDGHKYNVWHGVFLSGEKLIDNDEYKNELIKRFSAAKDSNVNIIGGEMEGVGLASVLSREDNSNWIIVKAICDWADGNKKENKRERQEKAATNAAQFCLKLFSTDLLTQIKGVRQVKGVKDVEKTEIVNAYVLFYYRNMHTLSFRRLSEKTRIPEEELRTYESIKDKQGKKIFQKTTQTNIKALRNALDCDAVICSEDTDEFMTKFYDRYKRKGRFYPVNDVKVVVFDFDGTLTRTENNYSSWQLIWLYLGYSLDDCGRYHRKYVNEEITHQEWCDITAEHFIRKKLSIEGVEAVAKKIKLIDGTIDTIRRVKEKGVKVYICSGAINNIIESVMGEEYSLFDGVSCNEFSYDRNGNLSSIKGTKFDFEGKADYVSKIVRENGIDPTECLFVGNSDNDIWAYESGVKTLVVNPHKITGMDRVVWKYYMEQMNNLSEILPFIFPHDDYLDIN